MKYKNYTSREVEFGNFSFIFFFFFAVLKDFIEFRGKGISKVL